MSSGWGIVCVYGAVDLHHQGARSDAQRGVSSMPRRYSEWVRFTSGVHLATLEDDDRYHDDP